MKNQPAPPNDDTTRSNTAIRLRSGKKRTRPAALARRNATSCYLGCCAWPSSRFFELGAAIEPISGLAALLPLCDILANSLLEVDVLACLAQPVCKACPLADQRLVADFNGGRSGDLVGGQQARSNEGISDLL